MDADALLLLQGGSCNHQIPAKTYEYLRAGKPILALTPDAGDTAELLRRSGGATLVDLDDERAISAKLLEFLRLVRTHRHPLPDPNRVVLYARDQQARALAEAFTALVRL